MLNRRTSGVSILRRGFSNASDPDEHRFFLAKCCIPPSTVTWSRQSSFASHSCWRPGVFSRPGEPGRQARAQDFLALGLHCAGGNFLHIKSIPGPAIGASSRMMLRHVRGEGPSAHATVHHASRQNRTAMNPVSPVHLSHSSDVPAGGRIIIWEISMSSGMQSEQLSPSHQHIRRTPEVTPLETRAPFQNHPVENVQITRQELTS